VGVLGFLFKYIGSTLLNVLIIFGIIILITGATPYLFIIQKEEREINRRLRELRK
jgi:protein-S-isoprenylcysteine O-methyltransferase Ste14